MPSTEYTPARREPRTHTAGQILIEISSGQVIRGELLDVSRHGFAMRHDYKDFVRGQEVNVIYEWGKVAARLVWFEISEGRMAAGFKWARQPV